eukprot:scaffold1769_cov132-Skeletonema_dohrnii-CCMP3373.AAC.5
MNLALALLATSFAAATDAITFSSLSAQQLVENYFVTQRIQLSSVTSRPLTTLALRCKPEDFHINDSDETTTDFGIETGDIHLEHNIAQGTQVLDPCFIQFEFSCPETTDIYTPQVSFDYVFGSEEYLQKKKKEDDADNEELINRGSHNDAIGFFLNGQNIALVIPDENGGVAAVSIEDVNEKRNTQYFVDNKSKNSTSVYSEVDADGFTTKLTAQGEAKPGWNIVKLAIGDVGDGNLDSWVLLEAGTFSCTLGDALKSFQPPATVEVEAVEVEAAKEPIVASGESESAPPQKMSGVAVFFILVVVIVVLGWVLLASGALKVNKVSNGKTTAALGKPNAGQMKAKSIEMYGTIKAKSIETFGKVKAKSSDTFGKVKAKSNEKFGSKKVNPTDESVAAPSKPVEQVTEQPVEEVDETDSNV